MAVGDEFSGILNQYSSQAQNAATTAQANEASDQNKADQLYNQVEQEGQGANETANKLGKLGDQYSNMSNVTNMYNTDEQSQLKNMGFSANTLNTANQNIAQTIGQEAAANNQIAAQGGTRGFNAVGTENRIQGIRQQENNALAPNTAIQSNELGMANAASTFTGQEIGAQQTSQQNAIQAYNDKAQQYNNTMANYANTMATMAQQATAQGGLVGSNLANIMQAGYSASQIAMQKYNAEVAVSQTNLNNASAYEATTQGTLNQSKAALNSQQLSYNAQMEPLQKQEREMVISNSRAASKQIAALQADINTNKNEFEAVSSDGLGPGWLSTVITTMTGTNKYANNISSDQQQINNLNGLVK